VGASYVDGSHGDATNFGLEQNTAGSADARFGNVDSYFLIDLNYRYELSETTAVFVSVQNAFDEAWLASRIPHGPRPGAPRQSSVGVDWTF
jgi:Fe(3+) dicitrate transport protein